MSLLSAPLLAAFIHLECLALFCQCQVILQVFNLFMYRLQILLFLFILHFNRLQICFLFFKFPGYTFAIYDRLTVPHLLFLCFLPGLLRACARVGVTMLYNPQLIQ